MADLTPTQLTNRVRTLCADHPFGFVEAVTPFSFDLEPHQQADGVFRVAPLEAGGSVGQSGYREERFDSLTIWVAQRHNQDFPSARAALTTLVHSLTAAVVRDGHQESGDYGVLDDGKSHEIAHEPGVEYLTLSLTLPVTYEVSL